MADNIYKSKYTAEQIETALSIVLSIAARDGIPAGTGEGSVRILSMDTSHLSAMSERIPSSAAVSRAISGALRVSECLVFRGSVDSTGLLPEGAAVGDTYVVKGEAGENYAWNGSSWVPVGRMIDPVTMTGQSVAYQIGDDPDTTPTGNWDSAMPAVPQGKYLWTRVTVQFSVGEPITWYTVAYFGVDSNIKTVCGKGPDADGNVALAAGDVGAVPASGGKMTGNLSVPAPTDNLHAANKGYVDTIVAAATLPVSGWAGDSAPYTQTIAVAGLTDERNCRVYPIFGDDFSANMDQQGACACVSYAKRTDYGITFTCLEDKPAVDITVEIELYV